MTTENTPTGGGNNPPPQNNGTPWFQGKITDNDLLGHMQNRGWHTKSAEEVAVAAVQAHREAERLRGVPSDELFRLPKDKASPEWNKLYTHLGRPESADKYDLSAVKFTSGAELDSAFADIVRQTAFKNNLSAEAAQDVARGVVKFMEDADAKEATERTARITTERAALAKNWGCKPDEASIKASPHMILAQRALAALGWDGEIVNAIEGQVGYAKTLNALADLGKKLGEDKFISGGGNNGLLTREQAQARLNDLKKDEGWVKKLLNGDVEAKRESEQLHRIILGIGG